MQSFVQKKYTTKRAKGQTVKIKSQPTSSFFQSVSTRSFDPKLEANLKVVREVTGNRPLTFAEKVVYKLEKPAVLFIYYRMHT